MAGFGQNDPVFDPSGGTTIAPPPTSVVPPVSGSTFGASDQFAPTLGHGTPTAEERAQRLEQERLARQASEQYGGIGTTGGFMGGIGPIRRLMASLRNTVGGMPLISRVPGISGFAHPTSGTQEGQDLSLLQTGRPIRARVGRVAGATVPYGVLGTVAPGLFSGVVPSGLTAGTIEGTDTALGGGTGGDVAQSAILGALSAIPGSVAGRIITPRGHAGSQAAIDELNALRSQASQEGVDASVDALHQALASIAGTHPDATVRPRVDGRFSSRRTGVQSSEDIQQILSGLDTAQQDLNRAGTPTMSMPHIGVDSNRIARSIENASQSAMWGLLSAGGGHMVGIDPVIAGGVGMMAPRIARGAINLTNRQIDRINRSLLGEGAPGPLRRAIFGRINNQHLSDQSRALLNAMSDPASYEYGGDALRSIYPHFPFSSAGER